LEEVSFKMSAIDDFVGLIEATEVVKQVIRSLKEEPGHILSDICREYEKTGQSVPDHHLNLVGYLSEASLKALMAAELIRQQSGSRLSLYCYEPTPRGIEQYEKLRAAGFYQK